MKNFAREGEVNKNSVLICLSGSGNSSNVVNAIEFASQ